MLSSSVNTCYSRAIPNLLLHLGGQDYDESALYGPAACRSVGSVMKSCCEAMENARDLAASGEIVKTCG